MSGSGDKRPVCSCRKTRCITGNCRCFRADFLCFEGCSCNDCRNTAENKAEYELRSKERSKQMTELKDGLQVPPDFRGCGCRKKTKCATGLCPCVANVYKCTSKCKCQDCANPLGLRGSDTNTEPRQGDTGGVSNVPDDTSSMAKEPPQVEEQDTESRDNSGSDQNKRPRLQ